MSKRQRNYNTDTPITILVLPKQTLLRMGGREEKMLRCVCIHHCWTPANLLQLTNLQKKNLDLLF